MKTIQREEKNNTLTTMIECRDFVDAVGTVNRLVPLAEKHQHHPNITIRDYNIVEIQLTTHDEGNTITEKDRKLADAISEYMSYYA